MTRARRRRRIPGCAGASSRRVGNGPRAVALRAAIRRPGNLDPSMTRNGPSKIVEGKSKGLFSIIRAAIGFSP